MQKSADRALLVDPVLGGKIEHVDAAECAVGSILHQRLDRRRRAGIGRLPQERKKIFGFVHRESYPALLRGKTRTSFGNREPLTLRP